MIMRVGGDIGAICRKCGDTWHVVVAIVAGAIAKVECKQCGGRHRYHSPDPAERAVRASGASARKAPAKRARNTAPAVEPDPSRPVRAYSVSERYAAGDTIEHPRFGRGVVQAIAGPSKIQVWFPDSERVLVHGRG